MKIPSWMRLVGNFFKTFWWIIVLFLAVVLSFGIFFFIKREKKVTGGEEIVTESFVKSVANKVSDAVTDVKVEKAITNTKSEILRTELEKIREEPDGVKRRDKLASILQNSL